MGLVLAGLVTALTGVAWYAWARRLTRMTEEQRARIAPAVTSLAFYATRPRLSAWFAWITIGLGALIVLYGVILAVL